MTGEELYHVPRHGVAEAGDAGRELLDQAAGRGVRHHQQARGRKLWVRVQGPSQGEPVGARHQAGAGGHRPPGHHQGDLHHATVRQSLCR